MSRLPAKYFDPVTELPYANLQAFKIIREAYYQQLEAKADKSDPEISQWLEWREKNRPGKQILASVTRPPAAFASQPVAAPRPPAPRPQPPMPAPVQTPALPQIPIPPQLPTTPQPQFVLPTRPLPISTCVTAAPVQVAAHLPSAILTLQPLLFITPPPPQVTARLPTSPATSLSTSQLTTTGGGRTIATTTLTAAQLQQLAAARGQVFVSALAQGGQVRPGQQVVRQGVAQIARPGQQVRAAGGQTSLIVQQPRTGVQTLIQRPGQQTQQVAVARATAGQARIPGTSQQITMQSNSPSIGNSSRLSPPPSSPPPPQSAQPGVS